MGTADVTGKVAMGLPEPDWDEPRFQRWVVATARANGWIVRVMDQRNARGVLRQQHADQRGWPDLLLVKPKASFDTLGRVVWLELKPKGGKVSPVQASKIEALQLSRAEVYVVTPEDWEFLLGSVL